MSRDKTKWVSQMISAKTRKMLEDIVKKNKTICSNRNRSLSRKSFRENEKVGQCPTFFKLKGKYKIMNEKLAILTIRMKNNLLAEEEIIDNQDDRHFDHTDYSNNQCYLSGYQKAISDLETVIKTMEEEEKEKKEMQSIIDSFNTRKFNTVLG